MSKFADEIRRASRPQPQSLGFGPARASAAGATMLLVGMARDAKGAADLAKRGAPVVLVGSGDRPAQTDAASGLDAIAGAWIQGAGDDEAKRYRQAGFDFVIVDPNRAAATALLDEEVGYVMALPPDLSDAEVRALEGFQLDALYVGAISGTLTVRRQIDLQRYFALTRKPLMASVPAGISSAELQALRDTNVAAVAGEGGDGVEKLRKLIDALPPRTRRRDPDRPFAVVPTRAAAAAGEEDDEHEHE